MVEEQGISEQSEPYSPNYHELEDLIIQKKSIMLMIRKIEHISINIIYYLGKLPFSHSHNRTLYAVPRWYRLQICFPLGYLLDWIYVKKIRLYWKSEVWNYPMGKKGSSSSHVVYPIFLVMYSSSLNVLDMKTNVRKTMTQHDLSNNPNRFAILDPSGGNWTEGFKI